MGNSNENEFNFDSLYDEYWSTLATGLLSFVENASEHSAKADWHNKVYQQSLADEFANMMKRASDSAKQLAHQADIRGVVGKTLQQGILDRFAQRALDLSQNMNFERLQSLNQANLSKIKSLVKAGTSVGAKFLGPVVTGFAILEKLQKDDVDGAFAVGISAVVGFIAASALVLAGSSFLAVTGLSILVGIGTEKLLNFVAKTEFVANGRLWLTDMMESFFGLGRDKTYTVFYDPLTIDLNGNGKLDVIGTDGGINFDFNGDGLAGNTGWVGKEDGILVFDDNQDGKVTNGSELFGNDFILGKKVLEDGSVVNIYAKNGFEALASLDTNGDGIVDANDKDFNKIKVWQDKNGDGKVDAGEMLTLKELGIKGLNTGYQLKNETVEGGNVLAEEGSFIREDGSTGLMGDINFIQDPTRAEFVDKVEMTDEQRTTSRVEGMGRVRDLNEALTLSAQVRIYYDALKNAPSKAFFMGGMLNFLTSWINADPAVKPKYAADWIEDDGISGTLSSQNTTTDKKPTIVNKYFVQMTAGTGGIGIRPGQGGNFILVPNVTDELVQKIQIINAFYNLEERQFYYLNLAHADEIIKQIEETYSALEFMLYQQIAGETRLAKYTDLITIDLSTFTLDYSKVAATFESYAENDPINAMVDLYEFLASGHNTNWKEGVGLLGRYFNQLFQMGMLDTAIDILGQNHIDFYAITGNWALTDQSIKGKTLDNTLYGGFGNDKLYGGSAGTNLLVGGKSDDYLEGGQSINGGYYAPSKGSQNTYQFSIGDGNDIINNYSKYQSNGDEDRDIIKFTNVKSNEVSYRGENYDLIIEYGQGDSIRVQDFFKGSQYWINEIHFADGIITHAELGKININIAVTDQNYAHQWLGETTLITNSDQNQTLKGNNGNDIIYGSDGNDTINGGAGDDTLYGGKGNDTINGDGGNDKLYGEEGDDILRAGGSDGHNELFGGEGNDKLYGGSAGTNLLVGGKSDDYLEGGQSINGGYYAPSKGSQNTYQFSIGDGNDIINNYSKYQSNGDEDRDIIKFTNVKSNEVSYRGENYDLIIEYGQGDSIRVQDFFKGSQYWINEIHFADGIITHAELGKININIAVTDQNYAHQWLGETTLITNSDQNQTLKGNNGNDIIYGSDGNDTINGGAGDDTLYGSKGNDTINGDGGNDKLYGEEGDDILRAGGSDGHNELFGGEGNDKLYGGSAGTNLLVGGKSDDYLEGGQSINGGYYAPSKGSQNTYQFSIGDGNDIINNYSKYQSNGDEDKDIIKFTNVKSNEVSYRGENYDLIIEYGQGDSIRVQDFFKGSQYWINEIHFADGIITHAELGKININIAVTDQNYAHQWLGETTLITNSDQNQTLKGNNGNDIIYGSDGNDTINGGAGDDTLYGGKGNDTINGDGGNDKLYGEEGDDILRAGGSDGHNELFGGEGNDKLYGGSAGTNLLVGGKSDDYLEGGQSINGGYYAPSKGSQNTYQFSIGDGNDIINNYSKYQSNGDEDKDIIKFTNVKSNEVSYRGENYDLIIEYGQGDSIRVQDFFKGSQYWINEIHFADGSIVKQNEIQGLIDAQVNQSLARTMSMATESSQITVNQELHSLINAMASFDSANNANDDFMVTSDQSLSQPMLTTSAY